MVASRLVIRHTFFELRPETEARRRSRAFTDSSFAYAGPEACGIENKDDASSGITTQAGSMAGSSRGSSPSRPCWSDIEDDSESVGSQTSPSQAVVQGPPGQLAPPSNPAEALEAHAQALHLAAAKLKAEARVATAALRRARASPAPSVFPPGQFNASQNKKREPARTTIVFRNLPSTLTRAKLTDFLDQSGFARLYSFVYLPMDFRTMAAFGYAIVNFHRHEDAELALQQLDGVQLATNAIITEWSATQQGQTALVQRYRDSPVMHPSMPHEYRPILLCNGSPVPFPAPTKALQPPRKFLERS